MGISKHIRRLWRMLTPGDPNPSENDGSSDETSSVYSMETTERVADEVNRRQECDLCWDEPHEDLCGAERGYIRCTRPEDHDGPHYSCTFDSHPQAKWHEYQCDCGETFMDHHTYGGHAVHCSERKVGGGENNPLGFYDPFAEFDKTHYIHPREDGETWTWTNGGTLAPEKTAKFKTEGGPEITRSQAEILLAAYQTFGRERFTTMELAEHFDGEYESAGDFSPRGALSRVASNGYVGRNKDKNPTEWHVIISPQMLERVE